ncbi:hypothetical protein NECAME_10530 [Necator americanus]|uniref:Translation initiation factor beta propellor-like domain-containing protein n=1 Tax=Necator americanus TaxID=51031 RepID=W2T808_NECAM|nr:hypothetical protein NECAME_10530 [Necator americanus]ETN78155.1 hypothetical protein NECAME_10530 [Necator americanus]
MTYCKFGENQIVVSYDDDGSVRYMLDAGCNYRTLSTPGRVQIRSLEAPFAVVAAKNFFKSEKATLLWNCKGNALIVLSSSEIDTSNQSYYGEQHIYLLNLTTQDSFQVTVRKQGPIHAAKWNPSGREFCVCHGFMPAMVKIASMV